MVEDAIAPVLSVVIPVRNAGALFGDQLAALAAQEFDRTWEVIVADNGSTDDTAQVARSFDEQLPGLQAVDASAQPARAIALNEGVAAAEGRSPLFLDSDDVVVPGYLSAMAAVLETSPFVAARLNSEALNFDWVRRSRRAARTDGIGAPHAFLPAAAGCSIGIWRSLFVAIGGIDSSLRAAIDVDLCWRVQLNSYAIRFVPEAVVHYRYRDTLHGIFAQAQRFGAAGPTLYRKLSSEGHAPPFMARCLSLSWRGALRFHGGVLVKLVKSRSRADIARCAFLLGVRIGILEGCVWNRVLYL